MHIDQPDSFRLWLESVLGPLCDADPIALARYVYALVRKDKPLDELRDTMVDQLDVFLQKETKSFVALMFKTIDNKEYLTYKKEVPLKEEKKEQSLKDERKEPSLKDEKKEDKEEEPTSSVEHVGAKIEPGKRDVEDGISSSEEKPLSQIQSSVVSESTEKEAAEKREDTHKKEVEREERFRLNRSKLKATGPGWNTRSRSRSWERVRRSRSRDRLEPQPRDRERVDVPPRDRDRLDQPSRERERDRDRLRDRPRMYRNKSPPRRYERRRSYNSLSPSPVRYRGGSRSKSRSPKFRRFRNRSPTHSRSRSRSRSRDSARSFERRGSPLKGDGMKDMGDGDRRGPPGGMMSGGNGRRCRDFDVRGFCLRGELCPYDHGKDPVVVNDLSLPPALSYGVNPPPGPGMMQGGPPMPGPHPPHMPPGGPPMHMFQNPPPMLMRPPPTMEYNPDAPSLNPNMSWGRPPYQPRTGPRMMQGMPFPPPNSRELINVPTNPHGGYHAENNPRGNCSLDIRKIPRCFNNIAHLNNHFAKFGTIVNIQVNINNDPEAATITFSSPAEANAAYKSTEAVLNNRFIKVVWHNSSKENLRSVNNVRDRLGNQPTQGGGHGEPIVIVPASTKSSKSNVWGARQKAQSELIMKNQIIRKKTEDTRKEALVLSSELRKRSQSLMEKQIEQQKELLKKLESGSLEEKQRVAIKDAIKHLQESIEKLKNEIVQGSKEVVKPVPKTQEQIQKEILDAEMDIIKAQQEGGDILPLQKTLGQLKMELKRLQQAVIPPVVIPPKVKYSPYSYSSHLTRGQPNSFTSKPVVDYRPTKILVSGYENDDKEALLTHFRKFGEVVDYIADDSTPSIVLNYKLRVEAQIAMNKGKSFQDRILSITWFNDPQLPPKRSTSPTNASTYFNIGSVLPGGGKIKQELKIELDDFDPDSVILKRNSSTSGSTYHMHAGRQVVLSGMKLKKEVKLESKQEPESADEENEDPELETSDDFLLQDDEDEGDDEERSWRR